LYRQPERRWGVASGDAPSGEIAAPERYWCGPMQATKKPGLTKERHGELQQSGFQPTGKPSPTVSCMMRWRPWGRVMSPYSSSSSVMISSRNDCNGPPALSHCRSGFPKEGLGLRDNHRLNRSVESTCVNVRGFPETDVPSSRGEKPGKRRSGHSSRRAGKPFTGRRATACWESRCKGNRMLKWGNRTHECR